MTGGPIRTYWVNQYAVPPDQPGGTRHYDFARDLTRRGHEVRIVASDLNLSTRSYSRRNRGLDPRPVTETTGGVSFTWLTAGSYRDNDWRRIFSMLVFSLSAFAHLLRAPRGDRTVFIGSSPHLFAALATLAAARLRRVPFVLEVRDLWPESYSEVSGRHKGPEITAMAWIARLLYRQADAVMVLAAPNRQRVADHGVPPERIHVVPNGVDLESFTASDSPGIDLRRGGAFTFVYAGAHGPANDLERVVEACGILTERGRTDIRVVLIGDGPTKADLRRRADEDGLTNVEFVDPVSKAAVAPTLRTADAGLMVLAPTDLFTYGVSPNKLFDYLAAGLPVITNVAGLVSDIVTAAGVGVVVEPGDARALAAGMEQMASDPPTEAATRGPRYIAQNYDRHVLAGVVEEILSSAAQR